MLWHVTVLRERNVFPCDTSRFEIFGTENNRLQIQVHFVINPNLHATFTYTECQIKVKTYYAEGSTTTIYFQGFRGDPVNTQVLKKDADGHCRLSQAALCLFEEVSEVLLTCISTLLRIHGRLQ